MARAVGIRPKFATRTESITKNPNSNPERLWKAGEGNQSPASFPQGKSWGGEGQTDTINNNKKLKKYDSAL